MIGNLLDLKPNKVSVDLTQYSMVWMGNKTVTRNLNKPVQNCTEV